MEIHKFVKKLLTFKTIINENFKIQDTNINLDLKELNNLDKNEINDLIINSTLNHIVKWTIIKNFEFHTKEIKEILEQIKKKYLEFMNENQINFYIKTKEIFNKDEITIEDIWNINKYIVWKQTNSESFPEEDSYEITEEIIENLEIMKKRIISWFQKLSKIPKIGIEINSKNKYLRTIIDFITEDSIINIEMNREKSIHKFQWIKLIVYLILGKLERNPLFFKIKKLIILNPMLNMYYILEIKNISNQILNFIEERVKILDYSEKINS